MILSGSCRSLYSLSDGLPGAPTAERHTARGLWSPVCPRDFLAEVYRRNPQTFRLFCPDETNSNRLGTVFDLSDRAFMERVTPEDVKISSTERVMEVKAVSRSPTEFAAGRAMEPARRSGWDKSPPLTRPISGRTL
jgi:hypothetical protein